MIYKVKTVFSLLIISLCGIFAAAANQNASEIPDSGNSITKSGSASSDHALYIGTGFGNDLLYDGSVLSASQPFISGDINYVFRRKLWASMAIYNLPQQEMLIPMADFSVGFNHVFNDYFDASVAFSNYRIAPELRAELHENFSFLRIRGGFDWYWLYTTVTAGTILGNDQGWYFYFRNSKYFRTANLGKSKSYFSFDPNINIAFGKTIYYQYDTQTKSMPGRPPIFNPDAQEDPSYTYDNRWEFMKMELSFPVAFYFNKFAIEAEPVYFLPRFKQHESLSDGFCFFLNAYFKIF